METAVFRLRWPHYLLAAATYLFLLLAWAPASLMTGALSAAGIPEVHFDRPRGSFWHGQADAVADISAGRVAGTVDWRFRPSDLLYGGLGYAIRLDAVQATAEGIVRFGPAYIALRDVQMRVALPWLLGFDAELGKLPLGGSLQLVADEFDLSRHAITGAAHVDWMEAVFAQRPLGRYRLDAEGQGDGLALRLRTLEGPLDLNGAGDWRVTHGLRFTGTAQARPGARGLDDVLKLLGPERSGAYEFRFSR